MQTCHDSESLRNQIAIWKHQGLSVALVPTMGNLHDGHLALVDHARNEADKVVVSIFVNPTQFNETNDFDTYPRTFDADSQKLSKAHTDLLFAPGMAVMYPRPNLTWVDTTELGDHLCGTSRPGHFRGVCTVVSKLFNLVQPDVACFGEKDFQQLAIIRRMTEDLCFPVRIVGVPTQRNAEGLALSSRNSHLTESDYSLASRLQQLLQSMKARVEAGERDYKKLCQTGKGQLENEGFQVDYVDLVNADTLTQATAGDTHLLLALAARLGNTRLIDNIPFHIESGK